jgi:hypothetical protein
MKQQVQSHGKLPMNGICASQTNTEDVAMPDGCILSREKAPVTGGKQHKSTTRSRWQNIAHTLQSSRECGSGRFMPIAQNNSSAARDHIPDLSTDFTACIFPVARSKDGMSRCTVCIDAFTVLRRLPSGCRRISTFHVEKQES